MPLGVLQRQGSTSTRSSCVQYVTVSPFGPFICRTVTVTSSCTQTTSQCVTPSLPRTPQDSFPVPSLSEKSSPSSCTTFWPDSDRCSFILCVSPPDPTEMNVVASVTVVADGLSRFEPLNTEWTLPLESLHAILQWTGPLQVRWISWPRQRNIISCSAALGIPVPSPRCSGLQLSRYRLVTGTTSKAFIYIYLPYSRSLIRSYSCYCIRLVF